MQTNKSKNTNPDNLTHTEEINPFRAKLRFPQHRGHQKNSDSQIKLYKIEGGDEKRLPFFAPPCDNAPPTRGDCRCG